MGRLVRQRAAVASRRAGLRLLRPDPQPPVRTCANTKYWIVSVVSLHKCPICTANLSFVGLKSATICATWAGCRWQPHPSIMHVSERTAKSTSQRSVCPHIALHYQLACKAGGQLSSAGSMCDRSSLPSTRRSPAARISSSQAMRAMQRAACCAALLLVAAAAGLAAPADGSTRRLLQARPVPAITGGSDVKDRKRCGALLGGCL